MLRTIDWPVGIECSPGGTGDRVDLFVHRSSIARRVVGGDKKRALDLAAVGAINVEFTPSPRPRMQMCTLVDWALDLLRVLGQQYI